MAIPVICLDTNYLIGGLVEGSPEESRLIQWYREGEILIASSVAWYEFRCGPVSHQEIAAINLFIHSVVPFTELEAEVAARLFEHTGRQRSLKTDAMIAATAMVSKSRLATNNLKDFQSFPGLKLI